MGKIYDALKRAEREARTIREKHQFLDGKDTPVPEIKNESMDTILDEQKEKAINVQKTAEKTNTPNLKLMRESTVPRKKEARGLSFVNTILKRGEKNVIQRTRTNRNLFALQDPDSHITEQYRILRTHILGFNEKNNMKGPRKICPTKV